MGILLDENSGAGAIVAGGALPLRVYRYGLAGSVAERECLHRGAAADQGESDRSSSAMALRIAAHLASLHGNADAAYEWCV